MLSIIYELKVDKARMNIPESNKIHVRLSIDDTYYNETGSGQVYDPKPYILIGDKRYGNNSFVEIELNKKIDIEAKTQYYFDGEKHEGAGSTNIIYANSDISHGIFFNILFDTGNDQQCDIRVEINREMGFWDVLFS